MRQKVGWGRGDEGDEGDEGDDGAWWCLAGRDNGVRTFRDAQGGNIARYDVARLYAV